MRISLLGPLEVEGREGERIEVGGAKQRLVLTALILARSNVVSTDRLVELVWAGDPPSKPYVTIRSYISHLRRALEPDRGPGDRARLVVTRPPGYALVVEPSAIDTVAFETDVGTGAEALERGRPAEAIERASQALARWRSEDLHDSPLVAFSGEVDRLRELRAEALAIRYDGMLTLGQHHQVIPDLARSVEAEPHRERLRAQLMVAYHRAGRSAEAIEVYQSGRRASIEATGLEPSVALQDLEARILADDPGLHRPTTPPGSEATPSRGGPASGLGAEGPPIIGRGQTVELARPRVTGGGGGLVAMTGEPGIGKSHLLDHLAQLAVGDGRAVAVGAGLPGRQTGSLSVWRAVLLDLTEQIDDETLACAVGGRGPELGALVPEVPARLGERTGALRDSLVLPETVVGILDRLADERALVLCFDDLHWADPASVRLISFVADRLAGRPVAIVAAWRDTESVDDELAGALAEVGALSGAMKIELRGLDRLDVGDLWRALGGPQLERIQAERLHRRTGGNPLFLAELVRSSEPASVGLTSNLRDAVNARLLALPEPCRQLVTVAALCPGGFGEELLAELTGLDADGLTDALETLLAARILTEDPGAIAQFVFTHPVIAESVVAQMSVARRGRLHGRIADALLRSEVPIGQLAHHYLQGVMIGDSTAAATSALEAARTSAALHDHRRAVDLIDRGLTALDRSDDDLLRAELLVDKAQASKHLQHIAETHGAAREAFRLARRAGDIETMVRAALVYCGQGAADELRGLEWLGYWNPPGPALEMLEECLEKLGPGSWGAMVRVAYATQLFGAEHDHPRSVDLLGRALDEARDLANPELVAGILSQKLTSHQRYLDAADRWRLASEARELAAAHGLVNLDVAAARHLQVVAVDHGRPEQARELTASAIAASKRLDDPLMAMMAESMPIALDLYEGRFDDVERALGAAMARYERVGAAAVDLFGIQWANLQRERGRLAEVESMMAWKLSGYPGPAYGMALALVMADQGKLTEAAQLVEEYGDPPLIVDAEGVLQFAPAAFYADVVVALGDRDRAAELYRLLGGAAGRVITLVNGLVFYGSGSLPLARLATLLGLVDEAEDHLDRAAAHHDAMGSRPYQLRTELARVELASARGRPGESERLLGAASGLATELGMTWVVDATRRRLDG